MHKHFIILLLLCIGIGLATSCNQYQLNIYSSIEGIVVDGDSLPIGGANVTISPSGINTLTASDGSFVFTGLERSKYTVTAQKSGYSTDRKEVSTYAGEAVSITLVLRK